MKTAGRIEHAIAIVAYARRLQQAMREVGWAPPLQVTDTDEAAGVIQ
jgi:hypothetical protein